MIDVGTNSVKLLVGEVAGGQVTPLFEESRQTRLGQGLYRTRQLQPGPIAATTVAVADFAAVAARWGVSRLRLVATSAAREAENQAALIAAVQGGTGLILTVISSEQETRWAFLGVARSPRFAGAPVLVADVGGGSTQVVLGQDAAIDYGQSLPLGAVRLLEQFPPADPPGPDELDRCQAWVRQLLQQQLQPGLGPVLAKIQPAPPRFVGLGGSSSLLAAMDLGLATFDRDRLEACTLSGDQVRRRRDFLWRLPAAQRACLPGLPPNRADVILMGTVIYAGLMAGLGLDRLEVSTGGYRFGALLDDAD